MTRLLLTLAAGFACAMALPAAAQERASPLPRPCTDADPRPESIGTRWLTTTGAYSIIHNLPGGGFCTMTTLEPDTAARIAELEADLDDALRLREALRELLDATEVP